MENTIRDSVTGKVVAVKELMYEFSGSKPSGLLPYLESILDNDQDRESVAQAMGFQSWKYYESSALEILAAVSHEIDNCTECNSMNFVENGWPCSVHG